jgi:Ca-activated chloride channel homolog
MSNPRSHSMGQIIVSESPFRLTSLSLLSYLTALLLIFTQTNCSHDNFTSSYDAGPSGATPGGLQDLNNARDLIAQEIVPPAEALLVEGLFSEHDLPLESSGCDEPLCIQGALGWQEDHGWLQLGLSSNIDMETFERTDLSLMLLIDVSGSMGWSYGNDGLPAAITRSLANRFITEMTVTDEVGIATFDYVAHSIQTLISGGNQDLLLEKIKTMATGGSTNMEAGLQLADAMISRSENETTQKRIILLTDAHANVNATNPASFMAMARSLAERGIGLTVIGCGLGLNPDLMSAMIDLQGANGFSLMNAEAVDTFFDDNWPYCVSPVATDLQVTVTPGPPFDLIRGYGFPGDTAGALSASTIFLSKARGALLVELGGGSLPDLSTTLEISYLTPAGDPVSQTLSLAMPPEASADESGRYFTEYGVQKTTALALVMHDLHQAAVIYGESQAAAATLAENGANRFRDDLEALVQIKPEDEAALRTDLAMAEALAVLMRGGAPQGTLYGGF